MTLDERTAETLHQDIMRRKLTLAVVDGELYANPAARITDDVRAHLIKHRSDLLTLYSHSDTGGLPLDRFEKIVDPRGHTLLTTAAPLPGHRAAPPTGSSRTEPTAPASPPPVSTRAPTLDPLIPRLPEHLARLLWAANNGTLPKKITPVGGDLIADLNAFVTQYAIIYLIGDQRRALEMLELGYLGWKADPQ
ncbi:hypothetical protein [Deinococcus soli (ex Cha et al. 2016)]|uniref:Uncharacterized protein n=2 Tax=Deinococcus soli (ex Cha et al. 2016) TaxID=1309411 RepID=A0AAE3XCN9_9DEIO|nr:hypothetical protein [Deinococcus soli (ex Cha et al. 2016)]MDR6218504.1 hypothetical protein [Deinococcus soli (ex Cha et al. 2016)]MDR6329244.1 hypothetical protein [Deinococcus soli (ex Cha et al. 2016)]MDR6751517.1 hypothetical protein [Deinococcus soli (ex Cha et al. 2016)]